VRFGHEGRAAFLPVAHETDPLAVFVEAVEHREVAFARDPEGVRDALLDQAFDDQMACGLR
jgi:hypothetical protein